MKIFSLWVHSIRKKYRDHLLKQLFPSISFYSPKSSSFFLLFFLNFFLIISMTKISAPRCINSTSTTKISSHNVGTKISKPKSQLTPRNLISQHRTLISQPRNLISQPRNLISQPRNLISQPRKLKTSTHTTETSTLNRETSNPQR